MPEVYLYMAGKVVVFEGPEGCGKSTQAKKALIYIRKNRKKAVLLREPGGTRISEKIRDIILSPVNKEMRPETELLLYEAARAQICGEKIAGLLKKGFVVVLDRFFLATNVYQGYARGLNKRIIEFLNRYTTQNVKVNLTLVYDVTLAEAKRRMRKKKKALTKKRGTKKKVPKKKEKKKKSDTWLLV